MSLTRGFMLMPKSLGNVMNCFSDVEAIVAPNVAPKISRIADGLRNAIGRTAVEHIGDHHGAEADHDPESTIHCLRLTSCGFGVGQQARPVRMLVLGRVVFRRRVVGAPAAEAGVHVQRALVVVEARRHFRGGLADEHLLAVGKGDDGVRSLLDQLRCGRG
jgi:hypothetical protein